jgi:single stranded DNA-binding protein
MGLMMKFINKVTLIGIIFKIEMSQTGAGSSAANFTVLTERDVPHNGAIKTLKEFHQCRCFGKAADMFDKAAGIGDIIYLEGEIQTSAYVDTKGISRENKQILAHIFNVFKNQQSQSSITPIDDDFYSGGSF